LVVASDPHAVLVLGTPKGARGPVKVATRVVPPPALSRVWSLAGHPNPLSQTDGSLNTQPQYGALRGFVLERSPPSDRTCCGVFRSRR
jgi:hypothetical protein